MNVGIDIGSKTIKLVELSKTSAGYRLNASGVVAYNGPGVNEMNDDKEYGNLCGVVKKLKKEAKIESKDASIALPESLVYTRIIKFPLLTDAEIASAVKWEAEQYIPIPVTEAVIQHQVVERRENTTPAQVLVLLVAAPKALVEKYAKVIETCGMNLVSVETELLALVRALAPADQTVLIVDFGAKATDIAVSRRGILSFSRSIPTAGDALTRALEQGLGVAAGQAEEYKRTYGLSSVQLEGRVKIALDPVFRLIAEEIKKTIHYYQSEERGEVPSSVILSGGSSNMPEAMTALTKYLGMEVIMGNPFEKVTLDPQAAKILAGYAPLYSIAAGLAMKD